MRVKISHSLELKDIPKRIRQIIKYELKDNLNHTLPKKFKKLLLCLKRENISLSLKKIEEMRLELAKIDFALEENSNILSQFKELNSEDWSHIENEVKEQSGDTANKEEQSGIE